MDKMCKYINIHNSQKMKFSIKDFFSKCDQIRSFLKIWSHFLKKSLRENFIFCTVPVIRITHVIAKCDFHVGFLFFFETD